MCVLLFLVVVAVADPDTNDATTGDTGKHSAGQQHEPVDVGQEMSALLRLVRERLAPEYVPQGPMLPDDWPALEDAGKGQSSSASASPQPTESSSSTPGEPNQVAEVSESLTVDPPR